MLIGKTLLGRYNIVRQLGGGGFGETYLAQDIALPGTPACVVKHLKPNTKDPQVLSTAKRLFDQEAKALYILGQHDQIPGLYAHFEEDGEFYVVQEFVDGHDLSQEVIVGKQLNEGQTVRIVQEILEILQFVHQNQVVHRDIKPENLMRRKRDGKLVLIDFGAIKNVRNLQFSQVQQASLTVAIGSSGYIPPEQFSGRPGLASDIYSVGIIGIQALTGLLPQQFNFDSATGEIAWRDSVSVSEGFERVLNSMIRYNFSQRYQNASVALQALVRVVVSKQSRPPTTIIMPDTEVSPGISSVANQPVPNGFLVTEAVKGSVFFKDENIRYQKIDETLKFYVDHLDKQYKSLAHQADTTYKLWLVSVVSGLIILVSGLGMTFSGKIAQGISTTASTVFVYFIQRIFQQREDHYRDQASIKNQHLEYGNQWLLIIQSIDAIDDPVERRKRQARLVEVLTNKLNLV